MTIEQLQQRGAKAQDFRTILDLKKEYLNDLVSRDGDVPKFMRLTIINAKKEIKEFEDHLKTL